MKIQILSKTLLSHQAWLKLVAKEEAMTVQFLLPDGSRFNFGEINVKNYKGLIVPGSKIHESNSEAMTITHQEFAHPLFRISHRIFSFFDRIKFSVKEHKGLRLEALLEGEVTISAKPQTREQKNSDRGEYVDFEEVK